MNHLEIAGTDISHWIRRAGMDGRILKFEARPDFVPQIEALLAQELNGSGQAEFTFREHRKPYQSCGKITISRSTVGGNQAVFSFRLK